MTDDTSVGTPLRPPIAVIVAQILVEDGRAEVPRLAIRCRLDAGHTIRRPDRPGRTANASAARPGSTRHSKGSAGNSVGIHMKQALRTLRDAGWVTRTDDDSVVVLNRPALLEYVRAWREQSSEGLL